MSDLHVHHRFLNLLPPFARPYALLARWDRPIGTWLLLLPCWWSLALAARGWPDIRLMLLFAAGAIAMRGAGCTINDIFDRDLDAQVERTKTRPLASGAVTPWQALIFLAMQLAAGLIVLLQLPPLAIGLGLVSLLPVTIYPLMKRVTFWPQFILGLTFNWGVFLGWAAATGKLTPPAFLLYIGAVMWTLVYDTVYAHQDKTDDAVIGVKSTARLFGARSRMILCGFAVLAVSFFAAAGFAAGLEIWFYIGLAVAAGWLFAHVMLWKIDDPADCLRRFCGHKIFGLMLLAAIAAGKFNL